MVPLALLTVVSLALLAFGKPLSGRVAHEKRSAPPKGFALDGPADGSTVLTLRVGLRQGDMAGLETELYAVSMPGNPKYGQHLTKDEVESYVKPAAASTSAVEDWLSNNSLDATKVSPAGDWTTIEIPVEKANELLDADFSKYIDSSSGKTVIRTLSYSLPDELAGHVDFFHPTVVFLPATPKRLPLAATPTTTINLAERQQINASCPTHVVPSCLQEAYSIPTTPATQSSNQIYVVGLDDQYAIESDLQIFLETFRPDLPANTTFAIAAIEGGSDPQSGPVGNEANLDTQYTVGLASGVPTTFISIGETDNDGVAGFLDLADYLLDMDTPPYVLTSSYGFDEADVTAAIANNLCNAYMQLGARGTSIFFSTGDFGVAGTADNSCTTFLPTFPSTCPYVTAVGATTLFDPETAADFSAGGFSNFFPQPSYQYTAVPAYLSSLGTTNEGLFNASGRGYPDVAAQGTSVFIAVDGHIGGVAGTSCSTPIFASVIALLNDRLIAAGKSPLGFLNPFLYANPSALTDITSGTGNPGCGTDGFPVTTGWDPVTGLGSPIFSALLSAAGL